MSLPINSLYSLTWGDYGTSLVSAVQLLRCHGDLVDCTLAAGGRSFPAHKIVLCAASPFLLDLLKVSFFFRSTKTEHIIHILHIGLVAPCESVRNTNGRRYLGRATQTIDVVLPTFASTVMLHPFP